MMYCKYALNEFGEVQFARTVHSKAIFCIENQKLHSFVLVT